MNFSREIYCYRWSLTYVLVLIIVYIRLSYGFCSKSLKLIIIMIIIILLLAYKYNDREREREKSIFQLLINSVVYSWDQVYWQSTVYIFYFCMFLSNDPDCCCYSCSPFTWCRSSMLLLFFAIRIACSKREWCPIRSCTHIRARSSSSFSFLFSPLYFFSSSFSLNSCSL